MTDLQDNNLTPVLHRFLDFLEKEGVAPRKAEELLSVGNGRLGKMKSNNTEIKRSLMENILQTFSKINRSWLENGEGDMLSATNEASSSAANPSINKDHKGVPYFDIDFVGGFDLVFNSHKVNPAFYIDFLPFNDADYWVNVTGKSMGPLIAHGDIIALKEVKEWKRFLLEGEIYAILTDNGFRTVKIIGKGPDKDHLMLIPYNKSDDYQPQPIPKEVITHVFRVKGAIKKFF